MNLTFWDPVGLPLDPLGPSKPTPWPPGTLSAYSLTSRDPVGLPLVHPDYPCNQTTLTNSTDRKNYQENKYRIRIIYFVLFCQTIRTDVFWVHWPSHAIISNGCQPSIQRCDVTFKSINAWLNSTEHFYRTRVQSLHWLPFSLTHFTHWLLFSRLDWCDLEVWRWILKTCWGCYCCWCFTEDHVGNSLLQIWELTFGPKSKLVFILWAQGSRIWSWSSARFWNWSFFSILSLMFCRGYEVESWSIFWS